MNTQMKKILLIHACDLVRGGTEKFLYEWTKAAPIEKYKFTWYCLGRVKNIEFLEEIKGNGVEFIEANRRKEKKFIRNIKLYYDLCKIIKTNRYDVIHINSGSPVVEFISVLVAARYNISVRIAHSHSCVQANNFIERFIVLLVQCFLRLEATCCVACSTKAGVSLFGEKILSSPKWKLIQNTIDTRSFSYNEKVRSVFRKKISASSHIVVGCVGLLNENKNQSLAINMVKKLKESGVENIKLILIGLDMLDGQLEREAERLGVDENVTFLGVSNCVEKWLQAMDIFLMPSKSEGLPIAALEAQAAGLPCILSDRISEEVRVSHYVDFVSIENVEEWASATIKYMSLSYDRMSESKFACGMGIDVSQIPTYMETLYNAL